MLFGVENNKGLVFENAKLKVVEIGENAITEEDIVVNYTSEIDSTLHMALMNMTLPDMPVDIGLIK